MSIDGWRGRELCSAVSYRASSPRVGTGPVDCVIQISVAFASVYLWVLLPTSPPGLVGQPRDCLLNRLAPPPVSGHCLPCVAPLGHLTWRGHWVRSSSSGSASCPVVQWFLGKWLFQSSFAACSPLTLDKSALESGLRRALLGRIPPLCPLGRHLHGGSFFWLRVSSLPGFSISHGTDCLPSLSVCQTTCTCPYAHADGFRLSSSPRSSQGTGACIYSQKDLDSSSGTCSSWWHDLG